MKAQMQQMKSPPMVIPQAQTPYQNNVISPFITQPFPVWMSANTPWMIRKILLIIP